MISQLSNKMCTHLLSDITNEYTSCLKAILLTKHCLKTSTIEVVAAGTMKAP